MESNDAEFTEYLKDIEFFANEITPPTWNVFLDHKDYRYKPRTLNIWLEILEEEQRSELEEVEHEFIGRVPTPMQFGLISHCTDFQSDAVTALEQYGDGVISSSQIQICPESDIEIECTIVHELSHIAVTRRKAQQSKPAKNILSLMSHTIDGEDEHGPTFLKAYKRMIIRTEKIFGDNKTIPMWLDLSYYKEMFK
jgi:hypothetical protein